MIMVNLITCWLTDFQWLLRVGISVVIWYRKWRRFYLCLPLFCHQVGDWGEQVPLCRVTGSNPAM